MRSAQRSEPVSVLDRILAILEAVRLAERPIPVAQLAASTDIPKSTVSRTVGELVRRRYLVRTEAGVAIGLRLFELGARASTPRRLGAAALPVLTELYNATGEHLNVAVQEGPDMVSVVSVRGRLRPAPSRAGGRVPATTTALGKAVLAFTDDASAVDALTTHLDHDARRRLQREFALVRRSAVAIDRCETFPGVVGVASPVLSPERSPVAAISVAGPASAMDADRMIPLVRHAALTLSRRWADQVA
jgi:IclR family acetate operon transcriptional repressor